MSYNGTNITRCMFPPDFLWERSLSIAISLITFYVLASILHYFWINRFKKRTCKINHLTILSASCTFLLGLNKMGEQWIGFISCYAYHWSAAVIYTLGIMITYTVLWARQRKMYCDKLLAYESRKELRIISNVIICCIYFTFGTSVFFFTTTYHFECLYYPCLLKWDEKVNTERVLVVTTFMVMCFVFQSALFLLLVYPIIKQKSCTSKLQALFFSKAKDDVEKLAKRLGFCAFACVVSSAIFCVIVLLNSSHFVRVFWCNLATLDLLTNTIATVVSFVDWKQRLFSLFLCFYGPRNNFLN